MTGVSVSGLCVRIHTPLPLEQPGAKSHHYNKRGPVQKPKHHYFMFYFYCLSFSKLKPKEFNYFLSFHSCTLTVWGSESADEE